MRKFDTSKLISEKEIFEQCFLCNDDFLDYVYSVYAKKYKSYSERWRQDNWDSFEDDIFKRFETMKKKLKKQIDTKK